MNVNLMEPPAIVASAPSWENHAAYQEIRTLLEAIDEHRYEIGVKLLELEAAGMPVDLVISMLGKERPGIAQVDLKNAMRWARGDFGEKERGRIAIQKIPGSRLVLMPNDKVKELLDGSKRILSPEQGRVVEKTLEEFTPKEVTANVMPYGLRGIDEQVDQPAPPFRGVKAVRYELRKNQICLFAQDPRVPAMIVTPGLLKKIQGEMETTD